MLEVDRGLARCLAFLKTPSNWSASRVSEPGLLRSVWLGPPGSQMHGLHDDSGIPKTGTTRWIVWIEWPSFCRDKRNSKLLPSESPISLSHRAISICCWTGIAGSANGTGIQLAKA